MRSLFVTFLALLLFACPILCGAAEFGAGAHHHAVGHDESDSGDCPESSDNCICRGAVTSTDVRTPQADLVGHFVFPIDLPTCRLDHGVHSHLRIDGAPAGLHAWGDSLTVRALLQNFRF